jgi:hypothetical protein
MAAMPAPRNHENRSRHSMCNGFKSLAPSYAREARGKMTVSRQHNKLDDDPAAPKNNHLSNDAS